MGNGAYAINNRSQVTGVSAFPGPEGTNGKPGPSTIYHAFFWDRDSGIRDLKTLPGDTFSWPGLNDDGTVVGGSLDASNNPTAFVWNNGKMSNSTASFQTAHRSPIFSSHSASTISDKSQASEQSPAALLTLSSQRPVTRTRAAQHCALGHHKQQRHHQLKRFAVGTIWHFAESGRSLFRLSPQLF